MANFSRCKRGPYIRNWVYMYFEIGNCKSRCVCTLRGENNLLITSCKLQCPTKRVGILCTFLWHKFYNTHRWIHFLHSLTVRARWLRQCCHFAHLLRKQLQVRDPESPGWRWMPPRFHYPSPKNLRPHDLQRKEHFKIILLSLKTKWGCIVQEKAAHGTWSVTYKRCTYWANT